jgi:hypothetical protein
MTVFNSISELFNAFPLSVLASDQSNVNGVTAPPSKNWTFKLEPFHKEQLTIAPQTDDPYPGCVV